MNSRPRGEWVAAIVLSLFVLVGMWYVIGPAVFWGGLGGLACAVGRSRLKGRRQDPESSTTPASTD